MAQPLSVREEAEWLLVYIAAQSRWDANTTVLFQRKWEALTFGFAESGVRLPSLIEEGHELKRIFSARLVASKRSESLRSRDVGLLNHERT
jgi:hypothetical protein